MLKIEDLNPRKDAISVVAVSQDKEEPKEEDKEAQAEKKAPKLSRDVLKIMVR